jgi:protein-tyrosine kinase
MAEPTGLIERAAALLRQREADPPAPVPAAPPAPASAPVASAPLASPLVEGRAPVDGAPPGPDIVPDPDLILDRGRLAAYGITIPSSERSRTVEEFRLVKRNLMSAWPAGDPLADAPQNRVIMVTSARPGEGKTFTSINLALAFASERDVKALLIDIDTQHPLIPSILGVPMKKGIVDVLLGDLELSDVLLRTNIPNLTILPAGPGGPHVPELFSSNRMASLMNEIMRRLPDHIIILDTPPCLASSDAAAVVPLVGQVVFIIEAHRTQQEEVETALSVLSTCPRISLLLNKTDTMASEHFGSYGYYYYPGRKVDGLRSDDSA